VLHPAGTGDRGADLAAWELSRAGIAWRPTVRPDPDGLDIVLLAPTRAGWTGHLGLCRDTVDLAQAALSTGVPVWACLPSGLVDWTADDPAAASLPDGLAWVDGDTVVTGLLTERGAAAPTDICALFPEQTLRGRDGLAACG